MNPLARRPLVLATLTSAAAISPLFLVGAQAVQIGAELRLTPASLGNAVSLFFGLTALSSVSLGRLVQRQGVRWSLVATMTGTSLSLVGVASSQTVVHLAIALAVGGLANGAVHPSANLLLASGPTRLSLGLSLGVKQSSPPFASLVAGLAVPVVALTLGWRWSFVAAAAASVTVLVAATGVRIDAPSGTVPRRRAGGAGGSRPLIAVAVAAGCGAAAGNSLGTFLVDFGAHGAGLSEASAGLAFALASAAGLAGRVLSGWVVDRPKGPGPHLLAVALLGAGAVGYLLIAVGQQVPYVVGSLVAYGLGWSWPSLLHYAVVRGNPGAEARSTGVLMTGFATGGFLGPLTLGHLATGVGYHVLWLVAAGLSVVAGVVLWVAVRLPGRD